MQKTVKWPPGLGVRAGARMLGAVGLMTLMACEGPGATPTQAQHAGFRANTPTHKVQLSAKQAQQLEQQGVQAQVLGDYGAFKLVQVDDKALDALPATDGVEVHDDYNHLLLNAGTLDTSTQHAQSLRGMKLQATGKRFHIVQFNGPVQAEAYKALEATGVKVVTYIPNNAYLVYGDAPALRGLQRHIDANPASIQWNSDYLDDYKLNPAVNTVATDTYAIQLIKDDEANPDTLALIRSLQSREGVTQEALGYVNVVAYLTRADLDAIVTRPDVLSIQPRPAPRKFDERQDVIIAGLLTNNVPTGPGYLAWLASKGFTQAQFDASGFGVDVSDSGVDNGTQTPNHFGLYKGGNVTGTSRVVYNRLEGTPNSGSTTQGCDGHGNLNTHIIAGYSNLTGTPYADTTGFTHGLGVAPFVKVGSSVVFDPGTFTDPVYEDLQARAYRDGMRVSSNSWGANSNLYDADAQRYDALVRDAQQAGSAVPNAGNQEMVILFAAGNQGSAANTVGTPGTAKNIITVGASENVRAFGSDNCSTTDTQADNAMDMATFSSRGPTSDGRKKPDIVAPGTHVSGGVAQVDGQRSPSPAFPTGQAISCFDGSGVCGGPSTSNFYPLNQQWYTASSGTSHSTPAVAGGAALVRQYFINQGIVPPSAAMTKAYLMNSARYMTGTGANDNLYSNSQGMGLMDLGMAFDGTPRMLDDQNPANLFTATGQTRTFTGVVPDASKPFRVTLAWTDAPGSTTGSAWKNNLDLAVTVGGSTYKGNVFTKGASVTGGTADAANNVESVFLPAGTTGAYTVTVTATNITSDGVPGNSSTLDQDFALIAYNSCTALTPAVTGVSAAGAGDNRISVSFTENGSASYNVYRSLTPGGPYTRVGTVAASPFVDTGASGGTTYYYTVRAVQCAESPNSNEASASTSGQCTLSPTFAGLTSAASAGAATCGNTLGWAAATPVCGGTVAYSVYRGTTAGFTPSSANRVATGISGTSFVDDANLAFGTTYYYVVRATETSNAVNEDTNTVQKSATPGGAVTPGVRYFDDFDGNRPANAAAYWIATTQSGTANTINLATCHSQSPTTGYRFGAANTTCSTTYPVSTQATLALGGNGTTAGINGFSIPTNAANPQMSFNIWYSFEAKYDGAWLVYSTTGATGPWTNVSDAVSSTAPYIVSGVYDNTLSSSSTTRIWTTTTAGVASNGALKPVTVNLAALAGQKVWFGFKFYSDITGVSEGFVVDDVRINADVVASCTTNTPPPGPAVTYKVSGLPASTGAGSPATFTVTALDAVGVVATGYSGTATFTSTDTKAVLPADVTFVDGVASNVAVDFRTLGTQAITATDTQNPSITGSGNTTVTAGAATKLVFTSQPVDANAGVSITPSVKVGLMDAFGNSVTTGTNSVTVALADNPTGAVLNGTTTVSMVSGVATFSGLNIQKVGTGYTLQASSTGLESVTSAAFAIKPGTASKVVFLTQPSNGFAGEPLQPAPQAAIVDAYGNLTTSTATVTMSLGANPGSGTLSGTLSTSAVNGVATFDNLLLDRPASGYKLTAASTGIAAAVSNAFDVAAGPPVRVRFVRQPSDIIAGSVISPPVQAALYDKLGNLVKESTLPVSVAFGLNPGGGPLNGTTTVELVDGLATFGDLSVDKAGTNYTLVVGASGLFTDTSVAFNVRAGAAAQLAFTASPTGNVRAGATFNVKVTARDVGGNLVPVPTDVTLSLANAAGATLSGPTVATTVNGVATFTGLSVDKAGSEYLLQASVDRVEPALSPAFDVVPGAPASVAFVTQPGNTVAGATFAPVAVALLDAQGNTVTSSGAGVTLAFASNEAGGTLSGTKTVAAIEGVATFSDLSVEKAGTGYSLKATSGAFSATSASFDVAVGAAAKLVFRGPVANGTAGEVLGAVELEVQDAAGNLVADSSAQVMLSLGGASNATLAGTTTVAAVNGVIRFADLSINRAGSGYTLSASAEGLSGATSGAFSIAPGAAAALAFTVQPGNTVAGASIAPAVTVSIVDALGNVVTDAADTVTLALADNAAGATLGGTTSVAAVNGVATFGDLAVARIGTGYTLNASSGALTGAASAAFDVVAGGATQLVFKLNPTSTTAGSSLGLVSVQVLDANGNLAAGAQHITLSLQGGTLAGTPTAVADNGVATFSDLSVSLAGTGYKLTAHADGVSDATSAAFDISHGPAAALAFTVQPGAAQAGTVLSPAVRVSIQDVYGNLVTDASDAITLKLGANLGAGVLAGTKTVNATHGVATFADLSINRAAEGYTLVATAGELTTTSAAFNISRNSVAKLVFRELPASVTAGEALTGLQVELQDSEGNLFSDSSLNVTLSLGDNAAGGQLFGSTTVAAVNGVATFEGLSLRKAGNGYTLVASAQGFGGGVSSAFSVAPGAAASLSLALAPSITAGQEATFSATAYDAYGNVASTYGGAVKVASSDAKALLPTKATFVEGVLSGLKVTFKSNGMRTVTLTDAANAALSGTAQTNVTPFAQPTVKVVDPVNGSTVTGKITISAEAVVAPGTTVSELALFVDGVMINKGSEAKLTGSWDSTGTPNDSAHSITAVVTDAAGNVSASVPLSVVTKNGGCGCGATSGTDASLYLGLLAMARYAQLRRRRAKAA